MLAFVRERDKRGSVLYEIEYKGIKVRSDDLEGAKEILRHIQGLPESPDYAPWSEEELREFTGRLKPLPKSALYALMYTLKSSRTDSELRSALCIHSNKALAGVLSGISKIALAMKIAPERVYRQSTTYSQGKPIRHYKLSRAFRKAVEKYGRNDRLLE